MEIEKGIPFQKFRHRMTKYPFQEMEVGDSISVESSTARSAAQNWGKKHGRKFSIRKTESGYRIWRVE